MFCSDIRDGEGKQEFENIMFRLQSGIGVRAIGTGKRTCYQEAESMYVIVYYFITVCFTLKNVTACGSISSVSLR